MATYNFPAHESGDTFLGVIFQLTDGNGDPIELDGCLIELKTFGLNAQTLSTGLNGGLTILDDSSEDAGRFMVDEQIISWPAGNYKYDIKFTFPSGKRRTYIEGHWEITK